MNNPYIHLNRIEFIVTYACTGRCIHCSQGDHSDRGTYIDGDAAARVVRQTAQLYDIRSVMTFGGEPLLCPDAVCRIHTAAREAGIPKRQLITNGFFSRDGIKIRDTARALAHAGVNDLLLSADAFHQATIPLEWVKIFAAEVMEAGIPLRLNPAWLVSAEDDNPYNEKTRAIIASLTALGVPDVLCGDGNVIFPEGNAVRYLAQYFDAAAPVVNPYEEDPADVRTVSVEPDGSALGGNVYTDSIADILTSYRP